MVFNPPGRDTVTGIITKYNRKSVTVVSEDGGIWNVAPTLLHRVASTSATRPSPVTPPASTGLGKPTGSATVISLPRK